jgi:hypothetical protein
MKLGNASVRIFCPEDQSYHILNGREILITLKRKDNSVLVIRAEQIGVNDQDISHLLKNTKFLHRIPPLEPNLKHMKVAF